MSDHDAAVKLTLRYLDILETSLKITWNEDHCPVCIIDWVSDDDVTALRDKLLGLFGNTLDADAKRATIEFGQAHIQTVGFGIAPDFDQFIKLGFIYGDRLVLWDVISSRVLASARPMHESKSLLAQITCQLLMLRTVAARGGLVILPHPVTWSPLAAEIDAELRALGNVPVASHGLSMAFAAIEEGLPLHPYTLLADGPKPEVAERLVGQADELFSSRNYVFHQSIGALLKDQRVAYLQDVRAERFFEIVAEHSSLRRALWTHFTSTLDGMSNQQVRHEVNALTDDLVGLMEKQNAAVIDYVAEGVDATAAFVLTSFASVSLGQPLLNSLAIVGALAVPLSTAVRKWAKKPERNVIVQAFEALQAAADSSMAAQQTEGIFPPSENPNIHEDIQGLYIKFMSYSWTEQRHHLLETLSPEVAKALLAALQPEDLDVIVNMRRFQHDYIGDYLEYISSLDEAIYWEHIRKTFESDEGLLIYDNNTHIRKMESSDMPMKAWLQLLDSLFEAYADEINSRNYEYPLERFPTIISYQTGSAHNVDKKRAALIALFNRLDRSDQAALIDFLAQAFDGNLPTWFQQEIRPK